jgi:DNA-directed RNA polymerase subunit RPC12/RpoP
MIEPREYVCERCGRPFYSERPDEEAVAEMEALLVPPPPGEDASLATLCTDCWRQFLEWASREGIIKS